MNTFKESRWEIDVGSERSFKIRGILVRKFFIEAPSPTTAQDPGSKTKIGIAGSGRAK